MIQLSQAAAREIKRLQLSRQQPNSYFRLGIKEGGCSNLYYTFELIESPESGDRVCESQGIAIAMNPSHLSYLQNLKLDYSEDLMGGGFRFSNPNAAATCGCGLSFS